MPPAKYIATILKPSTWGGAIELAVLANHFATQIDSIDVESGRIDHFEPTSTSNASGNRCLLIYSGIHYDAATLAPMPDADPEWHQTVFPITSTDDSADPITVAAKKLAAILRANRQYTNTATFDLRCEVRLPAHSPRVYPSFVHPPHPPLPYLYPRYILPLSFLFVPQECSC